MTDQERQQIIDDAAEELKTASLPFMVTLSMDITTALSIVASIQLANRHPGVDRAHKERTEGFIHGMIETFQNLQMPAHVRLIAAGQQDEEEAAAPTIQ